MSMGPSVIWQNFQGLWSADMPALLSMREHLEAKRDEAASYWDRIGPQMALETVNREIQRRERARVLANP